MRSLVSSTGALEADRTAETSFGYPPLLLMEEAGIRLQDRLDLLVTTLGAESGPVVYLVGPGNNGGDALAMARHRWIRGRADTALVQVFPPKTDQALWNSDLCRTLGIPWYPWPSAGAAGVLSDAAVWVDGLWGAGLQGPLKSGAAEVLQDLETLRARRSKAVAAIDVPSGLWDAWAPPEPVLAARWTLGAGKLKEFCFYPGAREFVGEPLEVVLSFPRGPVSAAELWEAPDLPDLAPALPPTAHKGTRGHVALVGGAPGMTGALVLAARSAAAAGTGLVTLGMDPGLISLVAPQVPAFQVRPADSLGTLASRFGALVAGPGWGRTPDRVQGLETLWQSGIPLVIDADGLAAWASLEPEPRAAPVVLTPHPGEFIRLGGDPSHPVSSAAGMARDRGVTVVLKGAVTWILASDGRRAVWDGANPALGTGGSGDCLAGVIGAYLARGLGGFEAARAGVVLHGVAGKALASEEGWFTADQLPGALARTASACRKTGVPL